MRFQQSKAFALCAIVACSASLARADDLAASDRFLCTAWHAAKCTAAGTCETTNPWRLNIPDFVRLELAGKLLTTTPAHSEPRTTPIDNVRRGDGLIQLTGHQGARAWSWVINEASGEGTLSISSRGVSIAVFSACTPIDNLTTDAQRSEGDGQ